MTKEETTGRVGERLAEKKFEKLGFVFENNIYKDHPHDYDFIVNGFNVEVKSTKNKIMNFNIQKNKGKFDVLVCVDVIRNIFLVIPEIKIKSMDGIKILPFTNTVNWNYYRKFIDKWEYLKN